MTGAAGHHVTVWQCIAMGAAATEVAICMHARERKSIQGCSNCCKGRRCCLAWLHRSFKHRKPKPIRPRPNERVRTCIYRPSMSNTGGETSGSCQRTWLHASRGGSCQNRRAAARGHGGARCCAHVCARAPRRCGAGWCLLWLRLCPGHVACGICVWGWLCCAVPWEDERSFVRMRRARYDSNTIAVQ